MMTRIGRIHIPHCSGQFWFIMAVITLLVIIKLLTQETQQRISHNGDLPPKPFGTFYISATFDLPGLGNLIFQYASMLGIAQQSHMVPIMTKSCKLNEVFVLPIIQTEESRPGSDWGKVVERKSSSFDTIISKMHFAHNIEVVGFLQSWKYFQNSEEDLRQKHFVFHPILVRESNDFLQSLQLDLSANQKENTLFIGVHIRRGDYLEKRFVKHGYTVADRLYLQNATQYFAQKYLHQTLIFVVCSDDLKWSKENFKTDYGKIVFSEGRTNIQDFALLSHCNHTIMTVGTYGWWVGWMAGGDVTYYKNFPKNNSILATHSFSPSKSDYFPPNWIPL